MSLHQEILNFLSENRIEYDTETIEGISVVIAHTRKNGKISIIPVPITARSPYEAEEQTSAISCCIDAIVSRTGERPIIIAQDRWYGQEEMLKTRLLAHLGIFTQVYARNCEIRKIDKALAADFLNRNHSYGDATCRYRYGLYLKRHTGHNSDSVDVAPGTLVAVATFSNARKWIKGGKTIRSYEWTRYASLPGLRICGGMGKLLKVFIEEVRPDDIMTYADLEWSEGDVYKSLGFSLEGYRQGIYYSLPELSKFEISDEPIFPLSPAPFIDAARCKGPLDHLHSRSRPLAGGGMSTPTFGSSDKVYFKNFGSNKYRLKLTDYH